MWLLGFRCFGGFWLTVAYTAEKNLGDNTVVEFKLLTFYSSYSKRDVTKKECVSCAHNARITNRSNVVQSISHNIVVF